MNRTKGFYKNTFGDILINNLSNDELGKLWKMKRRTIKSLYKIIITSDRCDYDNLTELSNFPEKGHKVGTFYYSYPYQLDLISKAFEGLFYQNIKLETEERIGAGILDCAIYDDWLDEECCCVCDGCFLKNYPIVIHGESFWTCKKELNKEDLKYEKMKI